MKLRHFGLVLALALAACGKKTPPPEPAKPTETTKPPEAKPPETKPETKPETTAAADAGTTTAVEDAGTTAAVEDAAAAPAPDEAQLAAGKRIAAIAGCALCHTAFGPTGPDLAKMWGGGLEVPDVIGTWRSPNISQDKKTGIGGWTDEQIATAIREGVRPDGSHLFPIMPYPFYNKMTDADVKALVAFMRTTAPVENAVAGNTDLKVPKLEVPKPANEAVADDPVHRGEYLSNLMHCMACHTPMTADGKGFDMTKLFAGGTSMEIPSFFDGTLYVPNITADAKTGVGGWSDAELATLFTTGKKKDGTPMIGPMALFVPGWATLPEGDIKDLTAWVRSIPPVENAVPKSTATPKGPPPPPGDAPKPDAPTPPGDAPKPDAPK